MNEARSRKFRETLARHALSVETYLSGALTAQPEFGEISRPETLMRAIRHGVLNGGKRFRPFLVLESAALFGAGEDAALPVAAALECVHCYSLIHDDLPAMDDDDLRRGQPTVHKAFDEATAILAGDGLLTFAFGLISGEAKSVAPEARLELIAALAAAAGPGGMVGGQALDLEAERDAPDEAGIITLQAMKTGALIRFACQAGAIIGGAPPADRERLSAFGAAIGLAFQLADDLLDLRSDAVTLGKATGKDAARGKATLAALHGAEWAEAQLVGLVQEAGELLAPYGTKAGLLEEAASFVASRTS